MRVAVYYNNQDVRIEEMAVPEIGPGEILFRMRAGGICGSDVMEWYRVKKAPLVLGHEVTGEIVAVGDSVKRFAVGERVFVSHHVPCNTCRYCLRGHHTVCETLHTTNFDPGGFSDYVRVPSLNVDRGVFVLPDGMSFEEGSFIEPLGCTVRGQRMAGLQPGDSVLVMGSGMSGILHIALARALGAGRIIATDVHPYRLNAAGRFGADAVLKASADTPEQVRAENNGRLADIVILCTGASSAFQQALQCVDRAGTILFFATTPPDFDLPLRVADIWRNGIRLLPSYGASPADIQSAMDLIENRRVPVREMITHELDLSDAALGFRLVAEASESLKVLLVSGA